MTPLSSVLYCFDLNSYLQLLPNLVYFYCGVAQQINQARLAAAYSVQFMQLTLDISTLE